jgi:putative acetyltransferase
MQFTDNQAVYKMVQTSLEQYNLDVPGTAYFDPYLDSLYQYYQDLKNGSYWVFEQNSEIIGGIGIAPFADYTEVAELQKYYVLKDYQGMGYGSLLYQTAEVYARKQGFKKIYIETIDVLDKANEVYKYFGFKRLEQPLEGSEHELMNRWFIKDL